MGLVKGRDGDMQALLDSAGMRWLERGCLSLSETSEGMKGKGAVPCLTDESWSEDTEGHGSSRSYRDPSHQRLTAVRLKSHRVM